VQGLLRGLSGCRGHLIFFEHHLLHSSLGSEASSALADLLQQQDFLFVQRRLLALGAALASQEPVLTPKALEDWLEGQDGFGELWGRRGFVGAGWDTLDLEGAGKASPGPCDHDVTEGLCLRPSGLFCPNLHLDPNPTSPNPNLVVFRQRRLCLCLVGAWRGEGLREVALLHMCLELQLGLRLPLLLLEQTLLASLRALPDPPLASPGPGQVRVLDLDGVRGALQLRGFPRPGPLHPQLVRTALLQLLSFPSSAGPLQGRASGLSRKLQRDLDWPRTPPFLWPLLPALSLEPSSARALGEVLSQLSGSEEVEAALRVRSASRGGHWVSGRRTGMPRSALTARLGPGQPLSLLGACRAGQIQVVLGEGLATLNELWAALSTLRDGGDDA